MTKKNTLKYASNSAEAGRLGLTKQEILSETEEELKGKEFLVEKQILARLTRAASAIKRKLLLGDITVLSAQASLRRIELEAKESGVNIKGIIRITGKNIEAIIENDKSANS